MQKLDATKGSFRSTKYQVPIEHLFICSTSHSDLIQPDHDSSTELSESDSSDDEVVIPEATTSSLGMEPVIVHPQSSPQRRPTRNRRPTQRFGTVQYNLDTPFNGEDDIVENWWPNHPRGTRPLNETDSE